MTRTKKETKYTAGQLKWRVDNAVKIERERCENRCREAAEAARLEERQRLREIIAIYQRGGLLGDSRAFATVLLGHVDSGISAVDLGFEPHHLIARKTENRLKKQGSRRRSRKAG